MPTIVLATCNEGKYREMMRLLQDCPVRWKKQSDFQLPAIDETGSTFIENAIQKARYVCKKTGLPALSDDSGLVIDVLNGEPGVYSARYAGKKASDQQNIARVLEKLKSQYADRSRAPFALKGEVSDQQGALIKARFYAVMAFMMHQNDPAPSLFHGCWEGFICMEPKGKQGFGYDPIFYVPTHRCRAAELPWSVKAEISHRGQALQAFLRAWPALKERVA